MQEVIHIARDSAKKTAAFYFINRLVNPALNTTNTMPELECIRNLQLKISFEKYFRVLVFLHLGEHTSTQSLMQLLKKDDFFDRVHTTPSVYDIEKSSFSKISNGRELEYLIYIFVNIECQASHLFSNAHKELGQLVGIDDSLIDDTLIMLWTDYREKSNKAKVQVDFHLNRSIPSKEYLSNDNGAEGAFVSQFLLKDRTDGMDRPYQCLKLFDKRHDDDQLSICKTILSTKKKVVVKHEIPDNNIAFVDAIILMGCADINQSLRFVRLVNYEIGQVKYLILTRCHDRSVQKKAQAYKLRWNIEGFFIFWKRYLKVYHLNACNAHSLTVYIISVQITYLLLVKHCHKKLQEKVAICRVR